MAKKGYIDVYKCREAFYNDVLKETESEIPLALDGGMNDFLM